MKDSILFLINSQPASPNAARAFESALTLRADGHPITLFLLQDAVLTGLKGEGSQAGMLMGHIQCKGISVYALGEDLAMRGFTQTNLRDGICIADYAQMVDLFETHTRVIGAL
ncbi:MAG: DsrE family protein [Chloroflexi bacterium]|nr:DsrE family protein [Chloroflexota bacterium]